MVLNVEKAELSHMFSCNICMAHTTEKSWAGGPKVDRLYEVQIGGLHSTLCKDCLHKLSKLIDEAL